jgi:hypothetical protein
MGSSGTGFVHASLVIGCASLQWYASASTDKIYSGNRLKRPKRGAAGMNWILKILLCGMLLASATTFVRQLMWRSAPFSKSLNVAWNGFIIGAGFAIAIHFAMEWIGYSHMAFGVLGTWGLISLLAIGYHANRVDWANTAKVTSTVAVASYVGVLLPLYVY